MIFLAVMTSAAIIIHFIESLFPLPFALPGIKLGLSNTVSLIVLYIYGPVPAFAVLVIRVILTAFLYAGLSGVIFSLAGGLLSFSAAVLIWRLRDKGYGIVGASTAGGVFHNIGQILAAYVVLRTDAVFFYLPVLILSGAITGIVTGILAGILVPRLKNIYGPS
ncbi:MAG: Gx transporter family protein [Clostridiaceae bacterium]|nr:Gx transporter family protein [Clostridiaceae bacterium]